MERIVQRSLISFFLTDASSLARDTLAGRHGRQETATQGSHARRGERLRPLRKVYLHDILARDRMIARWAGPTAWSVWGHWPQRPRARGRHRAKRSMRVRGHEKAGHRFLLVTPRLLPAGCSLPRRRR